MNIIKNTRQIVRGVMKKAAYFLDKISGGRVSPNSITIIGLLAHIPIALLIATDQYTASAVLLVVFGLFDALDGELARLQNKASPAGMLLDASTDRIKEAFLYTGAAFSISVGSQPTWAFIAVAACGGALSVSYIKAKGESAIATSGEKISHAELNRLFSDGLASFDVRILIFIIGLLTSQIIVSLAVIATLSLGTAIYRLAHISKYLSSHDTN